MSATDHPDNRGVFVELWVLDLLDGDHATALLLSQLLWWHQPAKNGQPKLNYERAGLRWLLRADDDWWNECRLTVKQVRRIRRQLVERGLVVTARYKLEGAPTSAWRPNYEALESEVPVFRTSPQGSLPTAPSVALPSDPQGAVPIPSRGTSTETSTSTSPAGRSRSLPDDFEVDEAMRAWANEKAPAVNLSAETEKFKDHALANGKRYTDWRAAWRTWIGNARDWAKPAAPSKPATPTVDPFSPEAMFGAGAGKW